MFSNAFKYLKEVLRDERNKLLQIFLVLIIVNILVGALNFIDPNLRSKMLYPLMGFSGELMTYQPYSMLTFFISLLSGVLTFYIIFFKIKAMLALDEEEFNILDISIKAIPKYLKYLLFCILLLLGIWLIILAISIFLIVVVAIIGAIIFAGNFNDFNPENITEGTAIIFGIIGFVFIIFILCVYVASFVYFAFTFYVMVDEDKGPFYSLGKSFKLVKGNFWRLFGCYFLIGLCLLPIYIVPFLCIKFLPTYPSLILRYLFGILGMFLAGILNVSFYRSLKSKFDLKNLEKDIEIEEKQERFEEEKTIEDKNEFNDEIEDYSETEDEDFEEGNNL